jgi:hypothetical protein
MKAIALAALAIPMVTAPALAGPYVMTKSEAKFSDENYKEAVNQAHLMLNLVVVPRLLMVEKPKVSLLLNLVVLSN